MTCSTAPALSKDALAAALCAMDGARVALIGDLCLDAYWHADMRVSQLSRETPHYPLPVVRESYSPGGAGNAAACVAALQPGVFMACGLVGQDWRGDMLMQALNDRHIDTQYVIAAPNRVTNAYIKPMRHGISDVVYEDPRIDFECHDDVDAATQEKLLAALLSMTSEADVICACDQMEHGCITPAIREALCELGRSGKTVIVDSRSRAALYHHVIVKPNEVEAARAFAPDCSGSIDAMADLCAQVSAKNSRPAVITLGENGSLVANGDAVTHVPACIVPPPIDFCGAGDAYLAGFATALAGGCSPVTAAQVATLCSSVTIRKIGVTGTASRDEVISLL